MPNPELNAAVAALNTATNALGTGVAAVGAGLDGVSTRVFALTERIKTSMTTAEVADVKAAIDAETNRIDNGVVALAAITTSLNGIAADPVEPVPEPLPAPVEELPTTPVV